MTSRSAFLYPCIVAAVGYLAACSEGTDSYGSHEALVTGNSQTAGKDAGSGLPACPSCADAGVSTDGGTDPVDASDSDASSDPAEAGVRDGGDR